MRKQVFAVWEPVSKNGREDVWDRACTCDELKKQQGRKPLLHGLKRLSGYFSLTTQLSAFRRTRTAARWSYVEDDTTQKVQDLIQLEKWERLLSTLTPSEWNLTFHFSDWNFTVGCLVNWLLLRYNIYICLEKIICTNAINSTSSSDRSYMPAQPADGE